VVASPAPFPSFNSQPPNPQQPFGATALDTAVLGTYGFSPKKDLLAQLLALNQSVADAIQKGEIAVSPGVPSNYADPQKLVTTDCIRRAVN